MSDDQSALSDQFHDWLLSYARMLDVDRAEDAVQEAFAALIVRQRRPPPVENAKGYLVRVVQRNVTRRRRSRLRMLPATNDHYDAYPDPDLARAIATLPQRQQACLALRFGHDLTIAAIADHLDITESTVRSHLTKGLDRLANVLGESA